MEPRSANVLFVLPDIGGYTQFMLHNKKTPQYAQQVIKSLMEAMIAQERMPLSVAEVEGDALFLYAEKKNELQWTLEKETISATIEGFFAAFYTELKRIMGEKACDCDSCSDIENLRIKVIVHYGSGIFDRIGNFNTLNGVDTIIVHRLLKNSLKGDYVFVTKAAFEECAFPDRSRFTPHSEHYDDVGDIDGFYFIPALRAL